jgi:hypothetical protein
LSGDIGVYGDASDNAYHVVTGASGATLDGFTITGGNAEIGGGSGSGSGGGMYNKNCTTGLAVSHCKFQGNKAATYGGAMYNSGSDVVISDCVLEENAAGPSGGGIYNYSSSPTIANCVFRGNAVANLGSGGAINNISSSPVVTSSVFAGNIATTGGGIYSNGGSPVITNCTFYNNSASDATNTGGALFDANSAAVTVANSILWGDLPDEVDGDGTETLVVRYSDIQDKNYQDLNGNINTDPGFVNTGAGTLDLHLAAGSSCIDAADNTKAPLTDREGRDRYDYPGVDHCAASSAECDGYADMGAYERVSE